MCTVCIRTCADVKFLVRYKKATPQEGICDNTTCSLQYSCTRRLKLLCSPFITTAGRGQSSTKAFLATLSAYLFHMNDYNYYIRTYINCLFNFSLHMGFILQENLPPITLWELHPLEWCDVCWSCLRSRTAHCSLQLSLF